MPTMGQVMSHVRGWPRPLLWREFDKVTTSRIPPNVAECSASFRLVTMPMVRSGTGATINPHFRINVFLNVHATADDAGTWVVKGNESRALLAHEQGHYDLAGLAAREYSRELLDLLAEGPIDPADIPGRVSAINDQIVEELALMNSLYDDERLGTDHGQNDDMQSRWNAFIPGHISSFLEPDLTWIEDLSIVLSG